MRMAGGVINLVSQDGSLNGAFEIISVDSATQLTVSVIRSDAQAQAISPAAAGNITYRVSTFTPQASEAGYRLTEYFGLKPGSPQSDYGAEDILDKSVLRQLSVFAILSSVYAMLASDKGDNLWEKSLYYRGEFEKLRQRCRVAIDIGTDGVADIIKMGGAFNLRRD